MEGNENVRMKSSGNRVVDSLVEWSAEDVRLREKFGSDVINKKHYGKEKYNFYVDVMAKYGKTKDPEEKRWLNMMKGEMNDIKKIAIPNKYLRAVHNVYEFLDSATKIYSNVFKAMLDGGKKIAKVAAEYREKRKDNAKESLLLKEKTRQETIKRYDEAVRPLLDKKNAGPDPRRNGVETDRGEEQNVRYSFGNDVPLISEKAGKGQSTASTDKSLLQKNRESTGKGLKM